MYYLEDLLIVKEYLIWKAYLLKNHRNTLCGHMTFHNLDFIAHMKSMVINYAFAFVVSFCYHLINPKHQGTDSQGRLN
jgi:hypothetical protein